MIELKNVCYTYNTKNMQEVLHNINMQIPDSKFVVLLGQSGSGKTTLLNIIAGLMKPSKGDVICNGELLYNNSSNGLCEYRYNNVGFIFQNYFLEDCYTALENVMVPLFLKKEMNDQERKKISIDILTQVGLGDKMNCKPPELSGGECQRISIARALVNNPSIIIADEPTGNLDTNNGNLVVEILKSQVELGKTVLMVTHNEKYTEYGDVVYRILDGVLE